MLLVRSGRCGLRDAVADAAIVEGRAGLEWEVLVVDHGDEELLGSNTQEETMATVIRRTRTLGITLMVAVGLAAPTGSSTTLRPPSWVLHGGYAPTIGPANNTGKMTRR